MIDAIRNLMAWTPLGLPAFLFVITVVVFFHELGHFLVARACGVKVDVFSVGFGKEIILGSEFDSNQPEAYLKSLRRT